MMSEYHLSVIPIKSLSYYSSCRLHKLPMKCNQFRHIHTEFFKNSE